MAARALIHLPTQARVGEVVEVRLLLQHPMESGFRVDALGRTLPRSIVRRVQARFNGRVVFGAELHPAIAANPYLAFALRVTEAGELRVDWHGDDGFAHTEVARIDIQAA